MASCPSKAGIWGWGGGQSPFPAMRLWSALLFNTRFIWVSSRKMNLFTYKLVPDPSPCSHPSDPDPGGRWAPGSLILRTQTLAPFGRGIPGEEPTNSGPRNPRLTPPSQAAPGVLGKPDFLECHPQHARRGFVRPHHCPQTASST